MTVIQCHKKCTEVLMHIHKRKTKKKSFRQTWWCFTLQEVNSTQCTESTRALQTNNQNIMGQVATKKECK